MVAMTPSPSCKVYTPLELATAMVKSVASTERQKWLEPSCGKGSFLQAIASLNEDRQDVLGIDLDKKNACADHLGTVLRGVDFLEWSSSYKARFDCAVGNPPYLAIRSLPLTLRKIASNVHDFEGKAVGHRANTWYPFLIRSIELLKEEGRLAFVLPAASEYADYAALGRSRLTNLFARVDVIRSLKPLFPGVSEGVVVLIARGKGSSGGLYRRHIVENIDEAISTISDLDAKKARSCKQSPCLSKTDRTIPVRDLIDLRIGAVTGDSKFFLISEQQRVNFQLPRRSLRPVVSRSSHILTHRHSRESWENLRDLNERVWLFYPDKKCLLESNVLKYLELDEKEGGCHRMRYKVRSRTPWYLTPLPSQPDLFLSGMSSQGVWFCINEFPGLTATNTLYLGNFKEKMSLNRKYAWALAILTSAVQRQIKQRNRIYADGLVKLEPSQIGSLEIPIPGKITNACSIYRKAILHLLAGKPEASAELADLHVLRKLL